MEIKVFGKKLHEQDALNLLEEYAPKLEAAYRLNANRSGADGSKEHKLPEDTLTELQFSDGTSWLAPTGEIPALFTEKTRSATGDFEIPAFIELPSGNRGAAQRIFIEVIKIFKKPIASKAADLVAQKIESSILQEGIHFLHPDFHLERFDADQHEERINLQKPILFFIHGTSSSTEGSFGGLRESQTWEGMQKRYNKNILTFEHFTWSKSPLQNALEILQQLPQKVTLHLVSHSRGGIIGDLLCRCSENGAPFSHSEMEGMRELGREDDAALLEQLNQEALKKQIKVEKFVRVACPAGGTTILAKRLDHYFNFLLSGLDLIPPIGTNPFYIAIKTLLVATIEQRHDPKSLPGLEAMIPETPLQKLLNNHQVSIKSDLNIISGNAGKGGIKSTTLYILARLYYRTDNDYVVDTDSMYMGVVRTNPSYYKFITGADITHFCYFTNSATQSALLRALKTAACEQPEGFKPVLRGEQNRGFTDLFKGKPVRPISIKEMDPAKPVLILLPGIMGSNLYDGHDEIWINLVKMAGGSLKRLAVDYPGIAADSLESSYYAKIEQEFSRDFNVLAVPYDWRNSISQAGDHLAQKITEALDAGFSIKIAAHSMGGLVARQLLLDDQHRPVWDRLCQDDQFRCLLLGTPWLGSYLIPEIVTGNGETINMLATLALFQRKKFLLDIFVKYEGLWELMPLFGHAFEEQALWDLLAKVIDKDNWAIPARENLKKFKAFKTEVLAKVRTLPLDRVYYIAGKDDSTTDNFVIRPVEALTGSETGAQGLEEMKKILADEQHDAELIFRGTAAGDGSVTWESGIPEQLDPEHLYFAQSTTHGELANDEKLFPAIREILLKGGTRRLPQTQPVSRAAEQAFDMPKTRIFPNDADALMRNVLGLKEYPLYEMDRQTSRQTVVVSVKNGHLRYSSHPLIIGHFDGDGIVSAEKEMNYLLDNKLAEREEIGLYPGPIGTNLVVLPDEQFDIGTVIVGLGYPENLTPFKLRQTIEAAVLEYALTKRNDPEFSDREIQISTLLVGSAYANLSLSNSINAILEGVVAANAKIETIDHGIPRISGLEVIELYKDKALNAFQILSDIETDNRVGNIQLDYPVKMVEGGRSYVPFDNEKEWWKRVTAQMKEECGDKYLDFSASTGSARINVRQSYVNQRIIRELIEENSKDPSWNRDLSKALFDLIVPNDYKLAFRDRQNVLLILDKHTAWYPWELLHYDKKGEPICISSGMIRQLATKYDRRIIKPVKSDNALIIGDPVLAIDSGFQQLQAAEQEAHIVNNQLKDKGFATKPLVRSSFQEIMVHLYDEYKVLHIASHGVVEYGDKKETGVLLSDRVILGTAEIQQMEHTPELVFINCCHLGNIHGRREEEYRSKFELAANIGTQFIENGVKAVVVAGWAVHDGAALRFAEEFYRNMLSGATFGDAVRMARKACYDDFSFTNTWGAYQCYGDQFFTLVKGRRSKQGDGTYIMEKQILIDLENFINDAGTARTRQGGDLLKRLQTISQKIETSGLRSAAVTEQEAKAYAQIEENEQAIFLYRSLHEDEKAGFSLKSIEQWCNLQGHLLVEKVDQDKQPAYPVYQKEIDAVIERLDYLLDLGATRERYNLLGSAYKRKSLLTDDPKVRKEAIIAMADNYRDACLFRNEDLSNARIYPLTNWLIGEALLQDKRSKRYRDLLKLLPNGPQAFLEERLKKLQDKVRDQKEFWDMIEVVNIYQCMILLAEDDRAIGQVADLIKQEYNKAWKKGGTFKQRNSEVTQMRFMYAATENFKKDNSSLLNALRGLIRYFEDLK